MKTKLLALLLIIFAAGFSACTDDPSDGGGGITYKIGDTGPGGGIIFYVDTTDIFPDWTYLEAAPSSTEWPGNQWGLSGTYLGVMGTGQSIGDGKANTAAIVAKLTSESEVGKETRAAWLCDALVSGGKDDWFLPSTDELREMCANLFLAAPPLGGFTSGYYWSSLESSTSSAYRYYFATAHSAGVTPKTTAATSRVRAIRSF